ncbi:MAG: tyrosine-type recombinase/integrase [Candidatus Aenigmarchaeota archaeon]|nr:tyrosine-type recombinase/integrase [Candidatus Aenigmarchaeota archaeon]
MAGHISQDGIRRGGKRNAYFALMFLYYAGLRLNEASSLKWEDIDIERELIHVKHGKGGRDRVGIPVTKRREI